MSRKAFLSLTTGVKYTSIFPENSRKDTQEPISFRVSFVCLMTSVCGSKGIEKGPCDCPWESVYFTSIIWGPLKPGTVMVLLGTGNPVRESVCVDDCPVLV